MVVVVVVVTIVTHTFSVSGACVSACVRVSEREARIAIFLLRFPPVCCLPSPWIDWRDITAGEAPFRPESGLLYAAVDAENEGDCIL